MAKQVLVVGGGSIGERHARCFGKVDGVAVSMFEINPQLLEQLNAKYAFERTFTNWDDVPLGDFDVAVICTPANFHLPMVSRALECGCHVLCEKPLAVDPQGADEVIEQAKRSGLTTAVAYVWRCNAATRALKEVIGSGRLGPIRQVVGFWGQHFPTFRPAYAKVYYKDHKTGGGAIQDAITHNINAIEWMLGPSQSVYCDADHMVLPDVEVEDTVAMTLRFPQSAIGVMTINQFQKPNQGFYEFVGVETSARFWYPTMSVEVFDPQTQKWDGKAYPIHDRDEMFIAQAETFLRCVETGEPVPCTLEEGLATLRTIRAAFQSWETGRAVKTGNSA